MRTDQPPVTQDIWMFPPLGNPWKATGAEWDTYHHPWLPRNEHGWIRVEDGLPPDHIGSDPPRYLVYRTYSDPMDGSAVEEEMVAYRIDGRWKTADRFRAGIPCVTHWQPAPPPPAKEDR